jgi:hypothetical protein
MLSYLEYMIHETLYDGSRWMILIPLLLVCIYAGSRTLEGRARLVELLFWWIIVPLVIIFLCGLRKVDSSVLMPEQTIDVRQVFTGEYKLMALFLPLEFLLFRMSALDGKRITSSQGVTAFLKKQNRNRSAWLCGMQGIILAGFWMLLVYIVTVGILGISWGQKQLLGVSYAMEQIGIRGGGLERLDILVILFWLAGGILTLSAYLFQGQQLLQRTCGMQSMHGRNGGYLWATVFQAVLTFAIYFCIDNPEEWSRWYLRFACYIDFPVSLGLPVLVWCIWRLKRRKEQAVWNKNIKMEESPVKQFKGMHMIGIVLGVAACSLLTSCQKQESMENRAYIESLHVMQAGSEYEYRCELAYVNPELFSPVDMKASADVSEPMSEEESEVYEYTAQAGDIEEFNEEFYLLTGCQFDYSHLQGIYLEQGLYDSEAADESLTDIWENTQVVLSTPVYEEAVPIGKQKGRTLGDWLDKTEPS